VIARAAGFPDAERWSLRHHTGVSLIVVMKDAATRCGKIT
jgi:hypothetical protein